MGADNPTTEPESAERATEGTESTTTSTEQPAQPEIPPEVKRALAKANKEAETLRLRLKEFEDRDKSEAEKVAERAAAAEARAVELEARSLRLEVAFEKGLTPGQAKRLVGASREELEADADEILRDFPTKPATPPRPSGDIGQGPRSTAPPADPRAADLAQIEADIAAGKRR